MKEWAGFLVSRSLSLTFSIPWAEFVLLMTFPTGPKKKPNLTIDSETERLIAFLIIGYTKYWQT